MDSNTIKEDDSNPIECKNFDGILPNSCEVYIKVPKFKKFLINFEKYVSPKISFSSLTKEIYNFRIHLIPSTKNDLSLEIVFDNSIRTQSNIQVCFSVFSKLNNEFTKKYMAIFNIIQNGIFCIFIMVSMSIYI